MLRGCIVRGRWCIGCAKWCIDREVVWCNRYEGSGASGRWCTTELCTREAVYERGVCTLKVYEGGGVF